MSLKISLSLVGQSSALDAVGEEGRQYREAHVIQGVVDWPHQPFDIPAPSSWTEGGGRGARRY